MFRVTYDVTPKATNPDSDHVDWAVADAFVEGASPADVDAAVRAVIDRDGWNIREVIHESHEINVEDFDNPQARKAFEHARREGIAILYYHVP